MSSQPFEVTALLNAWSRGDRRALDRLLEGIYQELRRMAAVRMRGERRSHTLEPTSLVHEVLLRLMGQEPAHWAGRAQFFHVVGQMMRWVLTDHARARRREKRGGSRALVPLDALGAVRDAFAAPAEAERIAAMEEALADLAALDTRRGRVVELHFLAGFSLAETAALVGCSEATVSRDWKLARLWLARRLGGPGRRGEGELGAR